MNPVAFHELPDLRHPDRWVPLIVLDEQLDLPPRRLPPDLVEVQLRPRDHVLADLRKGSAEGRDHADFDRPLSLRLAHREREQSAEENPQPRQAP